MMTAPQDDGELARLRSVGRAFPETEVGMFGPGLTMTGTQEESL